MKVYQIISEASFTPATPAELSMMNPQQRLKYNRMKIQADQAAAASKSAADAKAAADRAKLRADRQKTASDLRYKKNNPISAAANAAGKKVAAAQASAQATPASTKKLPAALQKKVQNYLTFNKIGEHTVSARIAKVVGPALKIFKWIGWYEMIVDYYKDREAYDGLLAQGQKEIASGTPIQRMSGITDQEWQYINRLNTEQLIFNITTSALLPKIIKVVVGIITGANWAKRIVAGLAVPFTAGVSLTVLVASEVAIIYYQKWLTSPEGKQAIAEWLAGIIDPAIDSTVGVGMLTRELKKAENIAKTGDKSTVPAKDSAAPAGNDTAKPANAPVTQADRDASAAWVKTL